MNKVLLIALLFVAGCDDTYQNGKPHQFRYADFDATITVSYRLPGGGGEFIDRVFVEFVPTRVGAYIVEADHLEKVVSTPTDIVAKKFQFGSVHNVYVTFSDGKSIERTIIEIK